MFVGHCTGWVFVGVKKLIIWGYVAWPIVPDLFVAWSHEVVKNWTKSKWWWWEKMLNIALGGQQGDVMWLMLHVGAGRVWVGTAEQLLPGNYKPVIRVCPALTRSCLYCLAETWNTWNTVYDPGWTHQQELESWGAGLTQVGATVHWPKVSSRGMILSSVLHWVASWPGKWQLLVLSVVISL